MARKAGGPWDLRAATGSGQGDGDCSSLTAGNCHSNMNCNEDTEVK